MLYTDTQLFSFHFSLFAAWWRTPVMVWTNVMDKNCWPTFPQWECYVANIAGLVSTAMWFIVLFPQVLKNWYRKSVKGLSFLWAVANFTASLVNLFFAFSISLPLYMKVMAVYMPCLEFTILCQFMLYSQKPISTRLLALLVCLLLWGSIIELELNLPQSRDKIQWIAIALWSIETFPQVSTITKPYNHASLYCGLGYKLDHKKHELC